MKDKGRINELFVTGVGGQLGYNVMNELAKRGYEAVGTDMARNIPGSRMVS